MDLSREETSKLVALSETASELLVDILEEELPSQRVPTKNDLDFKKIIEQISPLCSLLAESYDLMYNHIQKQKISPESDYFKRIRK